jgi:leucyl aminopeptidase
VCLARDLANAPGNELTPERLADEARGIARASGARVQVLGVREMERLGMGAVLAVGKGSVNPPRFIVLEREPASARRPKQAKASPPRRAAAIPTVVLIGKGVTFDSGGISIKPREGMARMKYDMSGAAAVLGVFAALPSLDLPFRVIGLVPSAENMPGGRAFKPGDVVRAMDGTTIEVTNTDAEGRLVLADALCYARRFDPVVVVDLATLTGAISLALGHLAAGLFTRDEALAQELGDAARSSGERLWRMPLWEEYGDSLQSDVADLANSGAREGGASIAAAFLARFTKGLRWAHLDIASTAWAYSDRPHEGRGPTGFGVRLLLEWLAVRVAEK